MSVIVRHEAILRMEIKSHSSRVVFMMLVEAVSFISVHSERNSISETNTKDIGIANLLIRTI